MTTDIVDSDEDATPRGLHEHAGDLLAIGLSEDLLQALDGALPNLRLSRYDAGDPVYRQGSDVEALYLVKSGRIKLMSYSQDGNARIVRLHKRGSVLGLNGLLNEKHDHTAIAVDDIELYILPIQVIRVIEGLDSEAYHKLLEYSHEYLKEADTWITEFSTGGIRGRVARLVLYLMSQDDSTGRREVALLTVNEMAEIIGVTPESVSRVLAEFKRNGILSVIDEKNPDVYRCDAAALNREAAS
ncbi:MAG: Crp/Fnr family transcriptional regulator [Gammaproteobacteria bacterium]|jgi:CRP/FNR family transcriptional regulator